MWRLLSPQPNYLNQKHGLCQRDFWDLIQQELNLDQGLQLLLEMLKPWEVSQLKDGIKRKLEKQSRINNIQDCKDFIHDLILFIANSIVTYRGKQGNLYNYLCKRVNNYDWQNNLYNLNNNLDLGNVFWTPILTTNYIEAIIDLAYIDSWKAYLLWQHYIQGLSARQIATLTGYGKTLIAQDLKDIKYEFTF